MLTLKNKEFNAIILDEKDPENKGRYLVRIPTLQALLSEKRGIWVKNHVHKYRDNTGSGLGRYGQYFPLHPNTRVLVKFYENDFNTGYIDRILDDDIPNSTFTGTSEPAYQRGSTQLPRKRIPLPFGSAADRDEMYQLIRTPKYDHLFLISEDSAGNPIPKNSIHLYYRRDFSRLVFNSNGIYLTTKNKLFHFIDDDVYNEYLKSFYQYIKYDKHVIIDNERRDFIKANYYLMSDKSMYIQANDNSINVISHGKNGTINVTANSFIALTATERNAIISLYSRYFIGLLSESNTVIGSNKNVHVVSRDKITISSSSKIEIIAPIVEIKASRFIKKVITERKLSISPEKVLKDTQHIADSNLGKPSSSEMFQSEKSINYSDSLAPGEDRIDDSKHESMSVLSSLQLIRQVLSPPTVEDHPPKTLADIRALKAIRIIPAKPETIKFEDE